MSKPTKVSAEEILALLAARHSKDVFVSECKDGPTHYTTHIRLDAWAMPRSWAKPWTYGYEIKVSRSDFLKDDKWPAYLPLCHQFYFVAPTGMIAVEELPSGIGLLQVSKNAKMLRVKRRAALRSDVEVPEDLYRYVLMCRTSIRGEDASTRAERGDRWRGWLRDKEENQRLGYEVSQRIRELVAKVTSSHHAIAWENSQYQALQGVLDELGIDISEHMAVRKLKKLTKATSDVDAKYPRLLRRIADELEGL